MLITVLPSTLQNDSVQLHGVTDKPYYVQPNRGSVMENSLVADHTFRPSTIFEEEKTAYKGTSDAANVLENGATIEATDYASKR